MIPDPTEEFWSLVDKSGDCWEWLGWKDGRGYGRWRSAGSHRVALNWRDPIPSPRSRRQPYGKYRFTTSNRLACHTCDNPSCVNPDHLYWGTHAHNAEDRAKRHAKCEYTNVWKHRCSSAAAYDLGDVWACGSHYRLVVKLGRTDIPTIYDLTAVGAWAGSAEKKREAGQ